MGYKDGQDAHPTRLDSERESVLEGTSAAASSSFFFVKFSYSFKNRASLRSPVFSSDKNGEGGIRTPEGI